MFKKMFGAGDILRAIAQTNGRDRNVYLNAVDRVQESNAASQAQSITSFLLKAKTRAVGLRFLIEYLNQCPKHVLEKKANIWLTIITKACNKTEIILYGELIYAALALLVFQIQVVPEITKWFGATLLGKLYKSLCILGKEKKVSCTIAALKSVKHCLRYYPGPSKFERPQIMRYLLTLVDSSDPEIVFQCGICWLLLQPLRGSNVGNCNDKTQWQDYQLGLLGSLNFLLIDLFHNFKSDYNTMDTSTKLEYFTLQLEGDPVERVARMSRRFCNLLEFLKISLSQPYPSTKLIDPTKILCFIQNGLLLGEKNYVSKQNMDNACLTNLLPTLHSSLLDLLEALLDVCHTHLRMHFRLIISILQESLNNTKCSSPGSKIQLCNLRIKVYKITRLWLSTAGEGSGCDLMADRLVKHIFKDVMIPQTDIYLSSVADLGCSSRKYKKTRNTTEPNFQGETIGNKGKAALCKEAFQCLQELLTSAGYFLKPLLLKGIFYTTLAITLQISQKQMMIQSIYEDWPCRLELYKTLFNLIYLRNMTCTLPRNMCLYLLDESCKKDPISDIRIFSKSINASVEKTLHPERDSLMLRTTFQRHLMDETPNDFQQINDSVKYKQLYSEVNLRSMDVSIEAMPCTCVSESEPEILQNIIDATTANENYPEMPATNDILLNPNGDDRKFEINSTLSFDDIRQYSDVELNHNNEMLMKSKDYDYIEELNAAFVDELK